VSARLIAFEGGEGTGKSTQSALLAERLRGRGLEVVLTREPGGTPGAEAIRALLIEGARDRWTPVTEALLLNAARADHVERLIRPALARGAWVVSDRFVDSTFAYQGSGKGMRSGDLRELHRIACGGLQPDMTVLLDVPIAEGLARAHARGGTNRFEAEDNGFHERVRLGFWGLAEASPDTYRVVETGGGIEATAERVWAEVTRSAPQHGA